MKRLFLGVAVAVLLIFLGMLFGASALVWCGLQDHLGQADVALVLGNTVDAQGNPSPRLKARLDRALELYRDGYFKIIIVSGGTGTEGYPEGDAMKTYLLKEGVPAEAVVTDNQGINTQASAANTKAYLEANKLKSVLVVTQYFHVPRSVLAAEKAGISPVYSSHARYFELRDFYSIARELPAWLKYQFVY